jgi:hypothetical protein
MLIIVGAEIGPRDSVQIIFACAGLFIGVVISANVFGELAVLISSLNQRSADF